MKTVFLLPVVLLSAVFAVAQSVASTQPPAVKGHVLGETIQQFLDTSADLHGYVDTCRSSAATQSGNMDLNICPALLRAVDQGGSVRITENIMHTYKGHPYLEFLGFAEFNSGHLTRMALDQFASWESLYPDLLKKFGQPTTTQPRDAQDQSGKKISLSTATWTSPTYTVHAYEDQLAISYTRFVRVELTLTAPVPDEQEKQHKNALD